MARACTTSTRFLLSRLDLRRDQTNVIHAGLMADIDDVRHYRRSSRSCIPLDEHHLFRARGKDARQLVQQVGVGNMSCSLIL